MQISSILTTNLGIYGKVFIAFLINNKNEKVAIKGNSHYYIIIFKTNCRR